MDDKINEALEGFLVIIDVDNLNIPEEVIDIVRDGVTLVRINDNDRKQLNIYNSVNTSYRCGFSV